MSQIQAQGAIPSKQTTVQIDVIGELTKTRYLGSFTVKILNQKERALVQRHKAFLNGDHANQLDIATLNYHHMVAYLRYALVSPPEGEMPKFWLTSDLGYELYDQNVVIELYNKAIEFEETWYRSIWGDEALTSEKKDEPKAES